MKARIQTPTIFVETGAYRGDGIQGLLQTGHFSEIHSIELSPKWVEHCKARFQHDPSVHIHEGDSATILTHMIDTNQLPNSPILFYLDAHYSGGETAGDDRDNGCPVLRELEAIAKRNVKGDIIFIDDMRLMGRDSWSGIDGSEYPRTYFDFRHVTEMAIEQTMASRKIVHKSMCRGYDRMLIVLE